MGEMVSHVQKFTPRQSGERKLVATFSSRELIDVIGSRPVLVRDWNVLLIKTSEWSMTFEKETMEDILPLPPYPTPLRRPPTGGAFYATPKICYKKKTEEISHFLRDWRYIIIECVIPTPLASSENFLGDGFHFFFIFLWLGDGFQSIEYSFTENQNFINDNKRKNTK